MDDLELARRAALAGADVGLRYAQTLADLPQELKTDGSVVTAADRAVEAAIREVLAGERPGDAILGEEGGQTGEAQRRWIIDPIDGTALFVAGDDRWLVLVALEEAGDIVAAVAAIPAKGMSFWAARGAGAYAGACDLAPGRRLAVDPGGPDTLPGSRLGFVPAASGPQDAPESSGGGQMESALLPAVALAPLQVITPALPWALHPALLVASGELDLAVQRGGQIWDFAATSLIVTEAGGSYSGLAGDTRPGPGASVYARSEKLRLEALNVLAGPREDHGAGTRFA